MSKWKLNGDNYNRVVGGNREEVCKWTHKHTRPHMLATYRVIFCSVCIRWWHVHVKSPTAVTHCNSIFLYSCHRLPSRLKLYDNFKLLVYGISQSTVWILTQWWILSVNIKVNNYNVNNVINCHRLWQSNSTWINLINKNVISGYSLK